MRSRCADTARSCSTITTRAAPRDAASKPSAPLPAKRSRQASPSRRWPSQLNSVSRTRSGVGRNPGFDGTAMRRPRYSPAMIRSLPLLEFTDTMVAALSWAARLKAGLARTREVLNTPVPVLLARRRVDESLYEELEAALLQADCG